MAGSVGIVPFLAQQLPLIALALVIWQLLRLDLARRWERWTVLGVYLVALAAALWLNRVSAVVWLMNQLHASEDTTGDFLSTAAGMSIIGAAAGIACAWPMVYWALYSVATSPPARLIGRGIGRAARAVAVPLGFLWRHLAMLARIVWRGLSTVALMLRRGVSTVLHYAWIWAAAATRLLLAVTSTVGRYLWHITRTAGRYLWLGASAVLRPIWHVLAWTTIRVWNAAAAGLRLLLAAIVTVLDLAASAAYRLGLGVAFVARRVWRGASALLGYVESLVLVALRIAWLGLSTAGLYVRLGVVAVASRAWIGVSAVFRLLWSGASLAARYLWQRVSAVGVTLWHGVVAASAFVGRVVGATVGYLWLGLSTLLGYVWLGLSAVLGAVWHVLSIAARGVWAVVAVSARYARGVLVAAAGYLWLGLSTIAGYVATIAGYGWRGVRAVAGYVGAGLAVVGRGAWLIVSTVLGYIWRGVRVVAHYVEVGASAIYFLVLGAVLYIGRIVLAVLGYVWLGVSAVARRLSSWVLGGLRWLGHTLAFVIHYVGLGVVAVLRPLWRGIAAVLGLLGLGLSTLGRYIRLGGSAIVRAAWRGISAALCYLALGASTVVGVVGLAVAAVTPPIRGALGGGWSYLVLGVSTGALIVGWLAQALWRGLLVLGALLLRLPRLLVRTPVLAYLAVPGTARMLVWMARQRKGVPVMSSFGLTRERLLSLIATVWVFSIVFLSLFLFRCQLFGGTFVCPPEPKVQVFHWTTGHLLQTGSGLRLLQQMADDFNKAEHRTQAGTLIEVKIQYANGAVASRELISRVNGGGPIDPNLTNPTLVTPSASHWLVNVNYATNRQVVDLTDVRSRSIARTYVGILTYREMAECLGWPQKEIGYGDIIALRNDPQGWARYPCAKTEWGKKPLVAFTDPAESDTGRAVLFALWGMGAEKPMEALTVADLADPETVGFVRGFAGVVDHYMATTSIVNTKVYQGPRYGHFFIMPEDNLIRLYKGTEKAFVDGKEITAPAITSKMVMIYPKEGSLLRDNCACQVKADWVTPEQAEAGEQWVSYLHEDAQQRDFLTAGFRPGTDMAVGGPFTAAYGLDPREPAKVLYSERVKPEVGAAIDKAWPDVKKPGIVTFVADVSGSMLGDKLAQEQSGLIRALDGMAQTNRVGLVSFSESLGESVPVAPLSQNRYELRKSIDGMHASGQTALYNAIEVAVKMTDEAEGPDDAIRGVVVLTDGLSNRGGVHLDDLVSLMSVNEKVVTFEGMEDSGKPVEVGGQAVEKKQVIGTALALKTKHPIQIFFIGIGTNADMEIGRMMAQATDAEFQASAEKDLANVLATFGKYF